jgi:hypothetical protein
MPESYALFWDLTKYYFTGSVLYFPATIIVFAFVFSFIFRLLNPNIRMGPTFGVTLNALPLIAMIGIAALLLFVVGGDQSEPPGWVYVLTLVYAAGPYLFIGTLNFTTFFMYKGRVIWFLVLLALLIWPVIPNYVHYSYEIGCKVYGRNCGG